MTQSVGVFYFRIMIFNADEVLAKSLVKSDIKPCAFRASRALFEKFKKRCAKDRVKIYSSILQQIVADCLDHIRKGKPIKVDVAPTKDRSAVAFSCSLKVWKEFSKALSELGLDRVQTMEFLMQEYCRQRANRK